MGGPHSVRGRPQSSHCTQHWGLARRPSCRALGDDGPLQREAGCQRQKQRSGARRGFIGGVGGKGGGMVMGKEGLGTPGYSLEKVFRGPWGGATRGFLSLDTEASGAAHKESGKEKQLHQSSGTVLTSSQAIIIVTTHTLLSRLLYLSAQLYINS